MTPQEKYLNTVASKSAGRGNTGLYADTSQTKRQAAPVRASPTQRPSNVDRTLEFGSNVLKSAANLGKAAPGFVANIAVDTFKGVTDFADPIAKTVTGWYAKDQEQVNTLNAANERRLESVLKDYSAGNITKEQYKQHLDDIAKTRQKLTEQVSNNMKVIESDRKRVVDGAVSTAITIASVGSYSSLGATVKGSKFLKGTSLTSNVAFTKVGSALIRAEEIAAKIPSVRALLVRNGAKFGNTSRGVINQSIRDAAVGVLFKSPFMYHGTIDDIKDIYKDINGQNVGVGTIAKIAFTVTNAFDGGILGAGQEALKYGKFKITTKTLGRGSMLDDLSKRFKGENPRAWVDWIDEAVDETDKAQRVKWLKITQEMNLQRWPSSQDAVEAIAYHVSANGAVDISQKTFKEFMDGQVKYLQNFEKIDDLAGRGLIKNELGETIGRGKLALGTFDQTARTQFINEIKNMSYVDQVTHVQRLADENVYWAQNETMRNKVLQALNNTARDNGDVAKAIQAIDTGENLSQYLPEKLAREMAADGYILTAPVKNLTQFTPEESTRELITNQIINGIDTSPVIAPNPVLQTLSGSLTRTGLSTQAANDVAYKQLFTTVTNYIDELPVMGKMINPVVTQKYDTSKAGKFVLDTLQEYASKKAPLISTINSVNAISDIRQLRTGEIVEALAHRGVTVTRSEAKQIGNAILDGYKALPLELRGLGDRVVDNLFKYVPGFKTYNRVQSALRYTYNPFFRAQEEVETRLLTRVSTGNIIWAKSRAVLEETAAKLDAARLFNTGFSGAGARDDVVLGRITANISKGQKRDLAGMALSLAEKRGITIDDMILNHFDELEDSLKVIVQYSGKGVLSSPLARTLNLAFFPMRYNMKVASIAAKALAKQPPTVQYAVLKGIMDAGNWLKSDEGIIWQSENSEALGVLKWITPYGSIESVYNMLGGNVDSISDLGVLGGLPAGVIFQTLDSQGVFDNLPGPLKYQTPYVDPKTGKVYEDKIPVTVKARAAVALGDFINSTFTYPGRVLGLPGKGEAIRNGVGAVLKTNRKEYDYVNVEQNLTELQRRQSKILQEKALDDMTDDELLEIYRTNGQWSIPNLGVLVAQPKVRQPEPKTQLGRSGLPSAPKKAKKKRKDPTQPNAPTNPAFRDQFSGSIQR